MNYDRRRFWNYLILIGLVLPFVALAVMHYVSTMYPEGGQAPATSPAVAAPGAPARAAAAPAAASAPARAPAVASGAAEAPALLAAGDGRDLWVMVPITENQEPAFQLLRRSANTGVWRPAMHRLDSGGAAGDAQWNAPTPARGLALMRARADLEGASSPYLLGDPSTDLAGWVWRFSLEGFLPQASLPPRHVLKAVAGAPDELFVVTLGAPVAAARQIGDPLRINQAPASGTRRRFRDTAGAPAGSASAPAPSVEGPAPSVEAPAAPAPNAPASVVFNVYWLPPTPPPASAATAPAALPTLHPAAGDWCLLAPLGPPSEDALAVPASSSQIVLAEQNGRLMVFWADAGRSHEIRFRTLDYTRRQQSWSEPRGIPLAPEEFPNASRLYVLTLDQTLYLLWTRPNGTSLELRGGWINTDGKAAAAVHFIAPLPLDAAGTGLSAQDVAVGPSENSIVAVINNRDAGLRTLVFDGRGVLLEKLAPVVPQGPRRDLQLGQNFALVVVVLLVTLMLWQWRQKQPELSLPAGSIIAPLHLRLGAFAIDAVLPYAAALLLTGEWEGGGYLATFVSWFNVLSTPEDFAKATGLLVFLGLYLAHVTVGELLVRRSLGKALLGLQVVMVDGQAPPAGPVLIRNLVRLPECFVGVALVYLVLTPRRQRLGDLLARTVVIARQAPEVPADGDKK